MYFVFLVSCQEAGSRLLTDTVLARHTVASSLLRTCCASFCGLGSIFVVCASARGCCRCCPPTPTPVRLARSLVSHTVLFPKGQAVLLADVSPLSLHIFLGCCHLGEKSTASHGEGTRPALPPGYSQPSLPLCSLMPEIHQGTCLSCWALLASSKKRSRAF